ncbi:MAG: hypothetical protein HXY30_19315 [Pseudorhodoplanes sp.]|nr:hypothetical protein [Pseudorhodoplanes sp.]
MRATVAAICLALAIAPAAAQTQTDTKSDSIHSTGRTLSPATEGQMQPQGPTGPITTGESGGAPAESPQGQTPPNMQAAPEGSSKTIVDPPKN